MEDNLEMESHVSDTDLSSDVEHDVEVAAAATSVIPTKKVIAGDSADSMHRRNPKRMILVATCMLVVVVMLSWVPIVTRNQLQSRSRQQHSAVGADNNENPKDDSSSTKSEPDTTTALPPVEDVVVEDVVVEDPETTPMEAEPHDAEDVVEWVECTNDDTGYTPINAIYWSELGKVGDSKRPVERTFDVTPMHMVVVEEEDDENSPASVLFAVETVAAPLSEHAEQPILSYDQILGRRQSEAADFYDRLEMDVMDENVLVEVMSVPDDRLIYAGGHGFVAACMMAFAYHLPLALSPDDLWMVISNGFARYVQRNAEDLRDSFVNFAGKKKIRIREDALVKNPHHQDISFGSSPVVWQDKVFPKFSKAVANFTDQVNPAVHTTLVQDFTTSTPASRAASEITLMATMSEYFEFEMETMCGIPQIRLDGSRQDWESLRSRTLQLSEWMGKEGEGDDMQDWIPTVVIPILDEFIKSYDGHVNHCFWQNMVKFRKTGNDSGSYDFLSGWLPTLFPYLIKDDQVIVNPNLNRHWTEAAKGDMKGPRPNQIPLMLSSVPVLWEYYKVEYKMHFHAGFSGVAQESADGTVKPSIGWYVTEDPPSDI